MIAASGDIPSSLQPDPPTDTMIGPHALGSAFGTPLSAGLSEKTIKNGVPSGSSSSVLTESSQKNDKCLDNLEANKKNPPSSGPENVQVRRLWRMEKKIPNPIGKVLYLVPLIRLWIRLWLTLTKSTREQRSSSLIASWIKALHPLTWRFLGVSSPLDHLLTWLGDGLRQDGS
ncbi:hypothetical protein SUGI_0769870 [Cryptomeria japonica]|nr:hypothetical protein SUGI_0769870 [Cryptomeria japonica]